MRTSSYHQICQPANTSCLSSSSIEGNIPVPSKTQLFLLCIGTHPLWVSCGLCVRDYLFFSPVTLPLSTGSLPNMTSLSRLGKNPPSDPDSSLVFSPLLCSLWQDFLSSIIASYTTRSPSIYSNPLQLGFPLHILTEFFFFNVYFIEFLLAYW